MCVCDCEHTFIYTRNPLLYTPTITTPIIIQVYHITQPYREDRTSEIRTEIVIINNSKLLMYNGNNKQTNMLPFVFIEAKTILHCENEC